MINSFGHNKFAVFRTLNKEDFPKRKPLKDLFMGTFDSIIRGQAYAMKLNRQFPEQRFYMRKLEEFEIEKYNKMERVRFTAE